MSRRAGRSAVIVLALAAGACGSSPSGPGPSPTPTPSPVRRVLATKALTLPGGTTASETVDNVPAGTVDVRLAWNDDAVDLNLYVTDTNCSSVVEILGNACRVLGQATATARPEVVTFTAASTANYQIWARNVSTAPQAATVELGITR
jgi:hypothetical protein